MGLQEDRQRILQMLASGAVTVEEADQLLSALGGEKAGAANASPKYLRIVVEPKAGAKGDRVNVKVPMMLIRAGVKLASFLPTGAREQINSKMNEKGLGFDLNKVTPENLETLVSHLNEFTVDVDSAQETVKIFCE